MIGIRLVAAVLGIVVLAPLLGAGGPDPSVALAARRLVADRAERANAALAELEAAVAPAVDAARRGAARVVAGEEAPGPRLRDAASRLVGAGASEVYARTALRALEGALRAAGMEPVPSMDVPADELGSIGAQLEGTAAAADRFADLRRRAEGLVAQLDDALAALGDGALAAAADRVAEARADHDALADWELGVVTLPVWIETTDAMIDAVETIVAATAEGDTGAALAAADAFARLSEEAGPADRALRIAIGEGGSAVTAEPLGRLAAVLREVAATRLEVASIMQTRVAR